VLKINHSPLLLFLNVLQRVLPYRRVNQGHGDGARHQHHYRHLAHAGRHLAGNEVQLVAVVAVLGAQVVRVAALGVEQSEEDVAQTRAYEEETGDDQAVLAVVVAALIDNQLEGEAGEEGVE
jgi:hypothetical protein